MGYFERPVSIYQKCKVERCDTLGPFAEADTGTNTYLRLMIDPSVGALDGNTHATNLPGKYTRWLVIDRITARCRVPSSATASIAIAYNGTATTLVGTGAIANANRVTSSVSVKSDAQTAGVTFELPLLTDPGTYACNKFPLDQPFELDVYSTAAATDLADLSISVWYRIMELQ